MTLFQRFIVFIDCKEHHPDYLFSLLNQFDGQEYLTRQEVKYLSYRINEYRGRYND